MTQGETIISLLLIVIAWILYQIAKQLSFLTGRKIKFSFPRFTQKVRLPETRKKEESKEKLVN